MHIGLGDDLLAVHLGTRTRKNHTSRRDAFQSVNSEIAATVKDKLIEENKLRLPRRGSASDFQARSKFDDRVALVKYYPALDPDLFEFLIQRRIKGIIIEGTGLGHISADLHKAIKTAIDSGIVVGMTSQCLWGRVRMTVYDTGRDLLKIGVIPLEDMLAETALVKMMWVLGNYKRPEEIVSTLVDNLAGEITLRSPLRVGSK
jgi:glutamyl-tRNA(Gln) amidotransferase subunit D